jgi:hypothetical protein
MSNPQTTAVQGVSNSKRPPLDLGPMGGDKEYVLARAKDLLRTFEALLDAKINLVPDTGGWTNCQDTIAIPVEDPDAYLVMEHELSHWLFETDLQMTTTFVEYTVSRVLLRAGIQPSSVDALPYRKHLTGIIHALWNILEDWRCCWLWGELYAGGAELLQQRWHDICQYDMPEKAAEESLVTFLARVACGVDTPSADAVSQACKAPMRRALNLVEGVGPAACLGITGILIDEILDEILDKNPPPPSPPPPSQGGGGGQPPPKSKKSKKGTGGSGSPRLQKKKELQKESQHTLQLLSQMVPRKGPGSDASKPGGTGGIGSDDLKPGPKPKGGSSGLASIKKIINAEQKSSDETGLTPFHFLLKEEAERMQTRLEEARKAMMKNHDTAEQEQGQLILGFAQKCGIPVVEVTPSQPLPPPSESAYENRRILEQFRMKKRRKKDYDGDFNPGAFLDALGTGNLDQPFYTRRISVPVFELLFLFDVSGSMTMGQALPLTERALSDAIFAVQSIRSKAHMWAFSDVLYPFTEVGSLYGSGIRYGSTSMVQALDVAQKWAKRQVTQRAVMLVTDGWPTSCRAVGSTGNALLDLKNVLEEMRKDKIALSVLGIRNYTQTVEDATKMYDEAFGEGRYGVVGTFDDLSTELPKAVRVLAQAHVAKGMSR